MDRKKRSNRGRRHTHSRVKAPPRDTTTISDHEGLGDRESRVEEMDADLDNNKRVRVLVDSQQQQLPRNRPFTRKMAKEGGGGNQKQLVSPLNSPSEKNRAIGISNNQTDSHRKRKKPVPYSRRSWQEQKEMLDHEAERERRNEEQERQRLERLPSLDQLPVPELDKVRPSAPRNTTQFLINDREEYMNNGVDDVDGNSSTNEDGIDEHGTMKGMTDELLAFRDEMRKRQSEEEQELFRQRQQSSEDDQNAELLS